MTFTYAVPEISEYEIVDELVSDFTEGHFLAEEAAENYYRKHDGWEAPWPILFAIFDEAGRWIGNYRVQRECQPHFSAHLEDD